MLHRSLRHCRSLVLVWSWQTLAPIPLSPPHPSPLFPLAVARPLLRPSLWRRYQVADGWRYYAGALTTTVLQSSVEYLLLNYKNFQLIFLSG